MTLLKSDLRDNVPGEISAITEKTTPVGDDVLLIEDSEDTYAKKKLKVSSLPGGGGGLPLIPLLAGIASHDLSGWKAVGGLSFNPSDYTYTTSTLKLLAYTSDASHQFEARLWNVTTSAQVGTTITSTSLTPELKSLAVTMTSGANVYELQIRNADDSYTATCSGALLKLE